MAFTVVMAAAIAQQNPPSTTAQAQSPESIAVVVQNNSNMSWEDAASLLALARDMNMDTKALIAEHGTAAGTYYDLAPAYIIQKQSGKTFDEIWTMHSNGQTWLQIAQAQGVPTSYYNPTNMDTANWTDADFTKSLWQALLERDYGMTTDDLNTFTITDSFPLNEVVVSEVVAREDNTPASQIITAYNTNKDWRAIQQQYAMNTQSQTVATPPPPVATPPETTPPPVANPPTATPPVTNPPTAAQPPNPEQTPPPAQAQTSPPATGETTETTTTTSALHARIPYKIDSDIPSPIEEWQVMGADINPYNYWPEQAVTHQTYGLSRYHHRRHHYRVRRHRRR